jgi:hypothetical protein
MCSRAAGSCGELGLLTFGRGSRTVRKAGLTKFEQKLKRVKEKTEDKEGIRTK